MPLSLDSFRKAIIAMRGVSTRSKDEYFMASLDRITQDAIRAGVIQHFEFTYELAWKFMKRWLELNVGATVVDGVTRRELFRHAAEQRLISDVEAWMRFHDARNISTHTYEPEVADEVLRIAYAFLPEAQSLLENLEVRND
ncbi:MAG: nucleotidyltransferase substrate binding protein [Bacteroidia bacterium]|nr:nucleotidyltransferase substrate binding protein [Bacteroidia bacterium]